MHGLERETLNMKQEKGNLIYGFHTFVSSVLEIVFSCHDPRPFNNTIETQVKVSMNVCFCERIFNGSVSSSYWPSGYMFTLVL